MNAYKAERKELKKDRLKREVMVRDGHSATPMMTSESDIGREVSDVEDAYVREYYDIIMTVLSNMFYYKNVPKNIGQSGVKLIENQIRMGNIIPIGGTNADDIRILSLNYNMDYLTWNPSLNFMMVGAPTTQMEGGEIEMTLDTDFGSFRPINPFDVEASRKKLDINEGAFTVISNKALNLLAPVANGVHQAPNMTYGIGVLSDVPAMTLYAKRLANVEASMFANARAMRSSNVIFLDGNNADNLKIGEDILNGVPLITVQNQDKKLSDIIQRVSLSTTDYSTSLQAQKSNLLSSMWKRFGLNTNDENKESGVNLIESTGGALMADNMLMSYIDARQVAWDQINAVFGTEVEVVVNSDVYKIMRSVMINSMLNPEGNNNTPNNEPREKESEVNELEE